MRKTAMISFDLANSVHFSSPGGRRAGRAVGLGETVERHASLLTLIN